MKNLIALALAASLVACASEAPVTDTGSSPDPVQADGGPCGDGRVLSENEVCP
jgi:hypothetical protein